MSTFWCMSTVVSCLYLLTPSAAITCSGDCDPDSTECDPSGSCYFACTFWAECKDQTINCGDDSTCTIHCNTAASCNGVDVHAETSKSFTFLSTASSAASNVKVYCPDNGHQGGPTCFINATNDDLTSWSQFDGLDIYVIEGIHDVLITDCSSSRCGDVYLHGCGNTYYSNIRKLSDNYKQCNPPLFGGQHICNTYLSPTTSPTTGLPTASPIASPTMHPTMRPTAPSPTFAMENTIRLEIYVNDSNVTDAQIMDIVDKTVNKYLNKTFGDTSEYTVNVTLISYADHILIIDVIISSNVNIDKDILFIETGNVLLTEYGDQIKLLYDTTTSVPFSTDILNKSNDKNPDNSASYIIPIILLLLALIFILIIIYYHKKKKQRLNENKIGSELIEPGSAKIHIDGESEQSDDLNNNSNNIANNMSQEHIVKQNEDEDEDDDMYSNPNIDTQQSPIQNIVSAPGSNLSLPVSQIDVGEYKPNGIGIETRGNKQSIDEDLYERVSIVTTTTTQTTTTTTTNDDDDTLENDDAHSDQGEI